MSPIECPVCERKFGTTFIPLHGPVNDRCPGGMKVLTPDDVAKRLERATMRVWRIMLDARQEEHLYAALKSSPITYSGALQGLLAELLAWDIKPAKHGYYEEEGS